MKCHDFRHGFRCEPVLGNGAVRSRRLSSKERQQIASGYLFFEPRQVLRAFDLLAVSSKPVHGHSFRSPNLGPWHFGAATFQGSVFCVDNPFCQRCHFVYGRLALVLPAILTSTRAYSGCPPSWAQVCGCTLAWIPQKGRPQKEMSLHKCDVPFVS